MNKRKFYRMLSEKYGIPFEYVKFTVDPIYPYNGNKKLSTGELEAVENAVLWERVKENFERDRNRKESIFDGI